MEQKALFVLTRLLALCRLPYKIRSTTGLEVRNRFFLKIRSQRTILTKASNLTFWQTSQTLKLPSLLIVKKDVLILTSVPLNYRLVTLGPIVSTQKAVFIVTVDQATTELEKSALEVSVAMTPALRIKFVFHQPHWIASAKKTIYLTIWIIATVIRPGVARFSDFRKKFYVEKT